MSFRLCTLRVWQAAVILTVSGLVVGSAQAGSKQRGGKPIEFSAPRSDEVTTNLSQLTSKKDGLKQLEEDFYKPFQSLTPKGSLDGVIAPPVRPPSTSVIPSKRAKELLERRKNWAFMTPEDLMGGPTADEILKKPEFGADGQEKKDLPTFERYYQRLGNKPLTTKNPLQAKDEDQFGPTRKSNPTDERGIHEDLELPGGLKETAEALNKQFDPSASDSPFAAAQNQSQSPSHSRFSDTFGLGAHMPSKEQALEHKKFMDEYRAELDTIFHTPTATSSGNPLPAFPDTTPMTWKPAAGLPGLPSTASHKGLDAQADVLNPMLGPASLPDVNAQALGLPRLATTQPTVTPPRVTPVTPPYTAPTRSFR